MDCVTFIDSFAEMLEIPTEGRPLRSSKGCSSKVRRATHADVKLCCKCERPVTGYCRDANLQRHALTCCGRIADSGHNDIAKLKSLPMLSLRCKRCGRAIGGGTWNLRQHETTCGHRNKAKHEMDRLPHFTKHRCSTVRRATHADVKLCCKCERPITGYCRDANLQRHALTCRGTQADSLHNNIAFRRTPTITVRRSNSQRDARSQTRKCCRCERPISGVSGSVSRHILVCDGNSLEELESFMKVPMLSLRCKRCGRCIRGGTWNLRQHELTCGHHEKAKRDLNLKRLTYLRGVFKRKLCKSERVLNAEKLGAPARQAELNICGRCNATFRVKARLQQHVPTCNGIFGAEQLRKRLWRVKVSAERKRLAALGLSLEAESAVQGLLLNGEPKTRMCDRCGLNINGGEHNLQQHRLACERKLENAAGYANSRETQITCRLCRCTFASNSGYHRHISALKSRCRSLLKPSLQRAKVNCARCGKEFRCLFELTRHASVCSGKVRRVTAATEAYDTNERIEEVIESTELVGATAQFDAITLVIENEGLQEDAVSHGVVSTQGRSDLAGDGIAVANECNEATATLLATQEVEFDGEPPLVLQDCQDSSEELTPPYACNLCDKGFGQGLALEIHVKYLHVATDECAPFKCPTCAAPYSDVAKFRVHWITHKRNRFACPQCDCKFVWEGKYRDHYDRKHALRFHDCPECPKKFAFKVALAEHVMFVHKKKSPIQCPHCTKRFASKEGAYAEHQRHHSFPELTCELCGKTMNSRNTELFLVHMDQHFGYKRYKCKMCDLVFHTTHQQAKHMRTHTGAKPYACDLCPKTFASASNLILHKRVHLGIKPYLCEFCGKGFANPSNHKLHVRSMHLEPKAPRPSRPKKATEPKTPRPKKAPVPRKAAASKVGPGKSGVKRVGGGRKRKPPPVESESSDTETSLSLSSSDSEEEEGEGVIEGVEEGSIHGEEGDSREPDSPELSSAPGIFYMPSIAATTSTVVLTLQPRVAAYEEVATSASANVVVEALNVANGLLDFWSVMPS